MTTTETKTLKTATRLSDIYEKKHCQKVCRVVLFMVNYCILVALIMNDDDDGGGAFQSN